MSRKATVNSKDEETTFENPVFLAKKARKPKPKSVEEVAAEDTFDDDESEGGDGSSDCGSEDSGDSPQKNSRQRGSSDDSGSVDSGSKKVIIYKLLIVNYSYYYIYDQPIILITRGFLIRLLGKKAGFTEKMIPS